LRGENGFYGDAGALQLLACLARGMFELACPNSGGFKFDTKPSPVILHDIIFFKQVKLQPICLYAAFNGSVKVVKSRGDTPEYSLETVRELSHSLFFLRNINSMRETASILLYPPFLETLGAIAD
jgi:hypothetical protein